MFSYRLEEELQRHILDNFDSFYEFELIGNEISVENGKIDILAHDEDNVYVIELKRAEVTPKSIVQVSEYLPYIQSRYPSKNVIGYVSAPALSPKVNIKALPENVRIKLLENVSCTVKTNNQLSSRKILSSAIRNELHDGLKELSSQTKIPMSKLLDEAIEDLLKKRSK